MKELVLSERFKGPPKPLTFESYLREQDHPVSSHPEARDNRIVPLVILDCGSTLARLRQVRYVGKYLLAAVKERHMSARSVRANPHTGKNTIDAGTLEELEAYAYSLGVNDIENLPFAEKTPSTGCSIGKRPRPAVWNPMI